MHNIDRQAVTDIENTQNWEKVLVAFKSQYSQDIYDMWLKKCDCGVSKSGKTVLIGAPTRFIKDHINKEYAKTLFLFWKAIHPNIEKIAVFVGKKSSFREPEETPQIADVIQLPLWPETTRGAPNAALRGALFAAIDPRKRQAFERVTIAKEKDLKIIFTGLQLDQADRDVWEQALHMARQQPLGTEIYFTERGFLKELGRSSGKAQHEWLKKSLARLLGCGVEITHNNYTYAGSLLEFERNEHTQRYKLSINPKMMQLYAAGWTQNDFEERQKIGNRKYLALWLHGYLASHAEIYPMKIETFYRLSGSTNSDIYSFKQKLIEALEYLRMLNLIKNFEIKNDLVHIKKCHSKSQIRHLMKKDSKLKDFLEPK